MSSCSPTAFRNANAPQSIAGCFPTNTPCSQKKKKKPTENAQANVIYSLKGKEKQNSNKIKKTQQQQTRNHHHQKIRTEDTDFFL